jgi:photosystem II stability/assembly factor-like uncharacterized protein
MARTLLRTTVHPATSDTCFCEGRFMRSGRGLLLSSALGAFLLAGSAVRAAAPVAAAMELAPQWRLVGPFRGGWAEMIEGIPGHPDSFVFGASGGGVWRTDDAGRVWRSLFDQGPTAPIGSVAVAPSDGDTLYAGSGQPEPRYDVASGVGVFRSSDGGKSWQAAGLEKSAHIGRLWVDPRDAKVVLAAATGDFFAPNPERGVFRSTDGGKTWSHVLKIDADTGAVDLTADPKDPDRVFAATWQARQYPWQSYFTPIAGPGSGIYQSADGGVTWSRLRGRGWPAGPLGRISLAATRTTAGLRLYAVVSAGAASGLYRSDDGGGAWEKVNGEAAFTSYYASRVTADPADPDVVWLVGQSVRRCDHGGVRCEIVKGAPGGDDYHFVWIDPVHRGHMAVASDQGAQVSVDGGATWSSWYNQPTGQFYHLAADDRFPYRIYSGQQDSGTVGILSRSDYGAIGLRDWTSVGGEERDYDIPDPEDPDIVYASGLGGGINRYDARTGQSANVTPFPYANYGQRQTDTAHRFVWVTPIAVSRVGPTTLYEGGDVVWASTDRGDHWRIVSPDLTGKTSDAQRCGGDVAVADARACGYGGIWSLTPSPRHAGELWVGTDDGLVQLTRDGGQHWSNVTPPGVPDWAKIATIDVSAIADGVAYIAVDNQRQGDRQPHAFATHDYGATWKDIAADLPRDHFAAVVRADTVRPGLIFAGTDVGVLASWDDGGHWRALRGDLPTAWVRDLLVHGDDLVAATQGRAIWSLGDLALLRQATPGAGWPGIHLFEPAAAVRVRANANKDTPFPAEEPTGRNPPAGAVIDYWLPATAKGPVTLDIVDAAGVRVRRLSSEPAPVLPAKPYFTRAWLQPPPPLPSGAGLHQTVWDLHWSRPAALSFEYSIATAAGTDTALSPQGPLALPGDYQLVLTVDGVSSRVPLRLVQDPRSRATPADLKASLDLSLAIGDDLVVARRGYGETTLAKQTLESDLAKMKAPGRPLPQSEDLAARIEALVDAIKARPTAPGFLQLSAQLARLEGDLENADSAPTAPQAEARSAMRASLDAQWSAWSTLRDGRLGALNADLKRARLTPVSIPRDGLLKITLPDEGEDLP